MERPNSSCTEAGAWPIPSYLVLSLRISNTRIDQLSLSFDSWKDERLRNDCHSFKSPRFLFILFLFLFLFMLFNHNSRYMEQSH